MFWYHLFDVPCSKMDANRQTDYYARSSYHRFVILRVVQGANSCSSDFGGAHPFLFQVEKDFVIWNWLVDEKLLNY